MLRIVSSFFFFEKTYIHNYNCNDVTIICGLCVFGLCGSCVCVVVVRLCGMWCVCGAECVVVWSVTGGVVCVWWCGVCVLGFCVWLVCVVVFCNLFFR